MKISRIIFVCFISFNFVEIRHQVLKSPLIVSGLGITVASYAGLMQTMSVEAVAPRLTGSAVGYNGICTHLGGIIGPPAFGAIVDATGSYGGGWLLTGVVLAVGVFVVGFGFKAGRKP